MFQPIAMPTPTPPTAARLPIPVPRSTGASVRKTKPAVLGVLPARLAALEHDDGDLPRRLRLVLVVVRPDLVQPAPEPFAFLAFGVAGPRVEAVALDLHLHLGRLRQVEVPTGMLWCSTLRRDDHRVLSIQAVDERRRGLLPRLPPGRRQQQDRRAFAPDVAFFAVRLDVPADVLFTEQVAHANASIVFVANRSSACTASSRCSSFVSSSFVCESPSSDWTNTITVGIPARATSAASCSGPLGSRCDVPHTSRIDSSASSTRRSSNRIGSMLQMRSQATSMFSSSANRSLAAFARVSRRASLPASRRRT